MQQPHLLTGDEIATILGNGETRPDRQSTISAAARDLIGPPPLPALPISGLPTRPTTAASTACHG
ncbi:hypothetical protein GS506_17695 [Rhodococcus hoagii]|nr:hypothetical protein [Prescottella equi]